MSETLKKIARKHKPVKMYLWSFLEKYEQLFEPIRFEQLTILEFGVGGYKNPEKGGGSLKMWAEYFPNSKIVGVDINEKKLELPENAYFRRGSQSDLEFLQKLVDEFSGFDIIIDDASHVTSFTIASFEALWSYTKSFYAVEDLYLKSAEGTKEYFSSMEAADLSTDHLCVLRK